MKMTAAEVMEALEKRYPADKHVLVKEAPIDSMRMGRKIDLLAINVWKSRRFERHAIEIKVSRTDLMREIETPEKADWWVNHTHKFFLAVPKSLEEAAKGVLPVGWGLIVVSPEGRSVERVQAKMNPNPEDIPVETWVGVMRSIVNVGPYVLQRAKDEAFARGRDAAQEAMGLDVTPEEVQRMRRRLERAEEDFKALQSNVKRFEQQTGVNLQSWRIHGTELSDTEIQTRVMAYNSFAHAMRHMDGLVETIERAKTHTVRIQQGLEASLRMAQQPPSPVTTTSTPDFQGASSPNAEQS